MNRTGLMEVLDFVEEMSDDNHICLVYETEDELKNILVSYFEKGLMNNEVCVWVLSGSIQADDAMKALKMKISDLDIYIQKEQMILLNFQDLHTKGKVFDPEKVLQFWIEKKKQAFDKGFKGLRISGSGNWARGQQWVDLVNYEKLANDLIQKEQIKAVCTYSDKIAGLPEILSVGIHHSKVIIYQEDKWQIIDATNARLLFEKLGNSSLPD